MSKRGPRRQVYVRNKVKSSEEIGFLSTLIRKPATITEAELLEIVEDLNKNEEIDGFIVIPTTPAILTKKKLR